MRVALSRALLAAGKLITWGSIATLILGLWSAGPVLADQQDQRLDGLFAALADARDENEAAPLEATIWQIWGKSGQLKVDALFDRGRAAMQSGQFNEAVKLFSTLIELQPDFAEAWNKRATVFYLQHELVKSVVDIERTLALEPRHFGALSGLGLIFLARGDARGALEAFERVLEINPQSVSARINVDWLRKKLAIHGA